MWRIKSRIADAEKRGCRQCEQALWRHIGARHEDSPWWYLVPSLEAQIEILKQDSRVKDARIAELERDNRMLHAALMDEKQRRLAARTTFYPKRRGEAT